ncbi:hypothetical protein NL676_031579 [Syzygium grande]|nr:hypothetical protein NL676_031579 [Syzygium grande]
MLDGGEYPPTLWPAAVGFPLLSAVGSGRTGSDFCSDLWPYLLLALIVMIRSSTNLFGYADTASDRWSIAGDSWPSPVKRPSAASLSLRKRSDLV